MGNSWMSKLTKDFGKIAAEIPAPNARVLKMPSPSLNWAVSNGGITYGKAVCLYGPESGGKSLLMQLMLIQLQKDNPDGIAILFDAEYSFNPVWFKKLGGDLDRLVVRQSNDPVKIFDYIEKDLLQMLQDGCPVVGLAIDSVKAIRYPKDIKKVSTNQTMGGGGASYLGPALKAILPVIREYNLTTIMVQQVYEELDEMKKMRNPFIVPDGRALKHFCDYMLQVEKIETSKTVITQGTNIYGGENQIGHKVRVKCKKNRVGAPARVAEFSLDYEHGIVDQGNELFTLAKTLGVVFHPVNPDTGKQNPQMWQFREYTPIRGEANIRDWLVADQSLLDQVMFDCEHVSDERIAERNAVTQTADIEVDLDAL